MHKEKIRKIFYDYYSALKYARSLEKKGISAGIYSAYNWPEQSMHYVVDYS